MILRTLEIEGFRCFDRPLRVGDFAPGLNVLYGPNGAGKSTVLRALQHVMVDSYSLSGAAVKTAMQPWGRALSPRIAAAFLHDGAEWRIEKRFLAGAQAKLERMEAGVFRPVADGREADQRIREMLQAEGAPKGIAKDVHMGLLQVLWTPQGPPQLPHWSAGIRTTLQQAFGAALSSPAADQLVKRVGERSATYFTPTGQEKKSSPVTTLRVQEQRLREEWERYRAQWRAAGSSRESVMKLRGGIAAKEEQLAEMRPVLERARMQQRELAEATAAELQTRRALEGFDGRVRQWRADIGAEQELAVQVEASRTAYEASRRELEAAQALLPKMQALEAELNALRESGEDARAWPDLLRYRALGAECAALRAKLAALRAPSAPTIAELRRLHQQLQVKQAALETASLRVTLQAERALTVEFDGGSRTLAEGEVWEQASPQSVTLRLAGIGRFTAASANAQAAELASVVAELRQRMDAQLNGETLATLEARADQREQWQRELENKEAEARPLLARGAEWDELAARRAEWAAAPPDLDAIRRAWKACRDALEAMRGQFNLAALSAAEAAATTTLQNRLAQQAQVAARLAQHAAGEPLPELEAQRQEAELAWSAARTRLQTLQSERRSDLAQMEDALERLQGMRNADQQAAARYEGELAAVQAQNLYSRLAETEEALAECTANLERERRRAAALQLLQETLGESQRALSASLPEQIAEVATAHWRRIAGATAPAIRIDDTWTPAGLHVPDATATLDELSGGEAEQVAFATRLALATQLAQSGRQLAVFDDAFLATDPHRAGRILELLSEASETLQIILLTCHPERYANLAGVRAFDIEKLKQ